MNSTITNGKRHRGLSISSYLLLLCLLLLCTVPIRGQEVENYEAERQRALQLARESKFTEALPILERLARAKPADQEVIFHLGFATLVSAESGPDAATRKQMRAQAYSLLTQAKNLGMDTPLLQKLLSGLRPDGGDDPVFSRNPAVNEAMVRAEAAFSKGDLEGALAAYTLAFEKDPRLYEAALFAGDVLFKMSQPQKAGDWFARAIAIDPDRETAYRYWGDALMGQGKTLEARDKFVEALIAKPYDKLTTGALVVWANKTHSTLAHPKIDIPTGVSTPEKGKTTITLDTSSVLTGKDSGAAWMMYGMTRALWVNEKFAKQFPEEKSYRHSLAEEAEALRGVAVMAKAGKKPDLDPPLANLVRLNDAGLLEAYILLAHPDEGIAQDYERYRKDNRPKLRRYLLEFVISHGK
jgi:tetratricopeptide (TPR) repeat protein